MSGPLRNPADQLDKDILRPLCPNLHTTIPHITHSSRKTELSSRLLHIPTKSDTLNAPDNTGLKAIQLLLITHATNLTPGRYPVTCGKGGTRAIAGA